MKSTSSSKSEDKRIINTKNKLKGATLKLLNEKSISDFTVREICKKAGITTITFYTYYKDKYALADEIFGLLASKSADNFNELQASNNSDNDLPQACCNLLDAIISAYQDINGEFSLEVTKPDPYLFTSMSGIIVDKTSDFFDNINPAGNINKHAVSSFFCYGLWGFIYDGLKQGLSIEQIKKEAKRLIRSIISSD